MANPSEASERRLNRRVLLIGAVQGLAFAGIASRLGYLQFLHADTYTMLSQENRVKLNVVAPVRGQIFDRFGEPLADNRPNYRLILERGPLEPTLRSFRRIAGKIPFTPQQELALIEKIRQTRQQVPVLLKQDLSWEEMVTAEFYVASLPGLSIEEGQLRTYPLAERAAHLVGYVGRVAKEDVEKQTALYRLPEFKIGKSGVEQAHEQRLRGLSGSRELEVNARGIPVRELSYKPFAPGDSLPLTIDSELQDFAANRLGEESGSVIVMDAKYGQLLACASMPAFDPNQFSAGITTGYWNQLRENERNPLLNKAVSGMYPPGSTFKMITALAGLKAGVIKPHTSFFCPGHYRLGNRRFNCWKPGGHGWTDLTHALAESCDTFFYNIGERVGIDAITEMARQFGFGAPAEIGIVGEKAGLLPSDQWKRATHQTPWVKGDTINASIGQGFLLATPMQLAVMIARLASGQQTAPQLVYGGPPPVTSPLEVDASWLERVMVGMNAACNEKWGTAYWNSIRGEEYASMRMGGKTGTAQVKRIVQRGVDQSTLPWRHRHHALFVGYAPVQNPSLVVSVVIEHGGGGSSVAAPVARDVLLKAQQLAQETYNRYEWKA